MRATDVLVGAARRYADLLMRREQAKRSTLARSDPRAPDRDREARTGRADHERGLAKERGNRLFEWSGFIRPSHRTSEPDLKSSTVRGEGEG